MTVTIKRAELEGCLRRLHDGALQEVATLRVALAVWARAADTGDVETARQMVGELRALTDRLVDDLGAVQDQGRAWLTHG